MIPELPHGMTPVEVEELQSLRGLGHLAHPRVGDAQTPSKLDFL